MANLEFYLSRKILNSENSGKSAGPIVKVATLGVTIGMCIMLLSVFIITGFKKEVTNKVLGFSSAINVVAASKNVDGEEVGINPTNQLIDTLKSIDGVTEIYDYIEKPAILKVKQEIHGVLLKGMSSKYNGTFFKAYMVDGYYPDYSSSKTSDSIVISSQIALYLNLKVGDKVISHFVQNPPRVRVFRVAGIYSTGVKEFDNSIVVCDLRHLQKLNSWNSQKVSGLAINIEDISELEKVENKVQNVIEEIKWGEFMMLNDIKQNSYQIFDWLNLLDMNVWIILILVTIVAGFNMVSGLLILILDKSTMIGILKSLGYRNIKLKKLFLYVAMGLVGKGMLYGNILAFILAGIQYYFHPISLNPDVYYMEMVPINFSIIYIVVLNLAVLCLTMLMLILPTTLVSKIDPIKIISFGES